MNDFPASAFPEMLADIVRSGHPASFVAKGDSMHPTIRDGEKIVIAPVSEIQPGAVIAYLAAGRVFIHRVFQIRRDGTEAEFSLRGDNAARPDHPIRREQIIGRVIAVQRGDSVRRVGNAIPLYSRLWRWWRWCRVLNLP